MNRKFPVMAAIVLLTLSPDMARAQSITITSTDNSKAGRIKADGSYTLPDKWTFSQIRVECRPPKGVKGEGGTVLAIAIQKTKTFEGIVTVPTGTYDV